MAYEALEQAIQDLKQTNDVLVQTVQDKWSSANSAAAVAEQAAAAAGNSEVAAANSASSAEASQVSATASEESAAASAAAASTSEVNSAESESSAAASATAAASAADAAQLSAGVYADTAAGLAATADGEYFSVPSAESDEYLILYRHSGAEAIEQKRYPAVGRITALEGRTGALEDQSAVAASNIDALDLRMDTAEVALAELDSRLDTAEINLNSLSERADISDTEIASLGERTDQLEYDVGLAVKTSSTEDNNLLSGFVDEEGNMPLGFDAKGDSHLGSIEFETRDMTDVGTDTGKYVLLPIYDEEKNLLFGIDRRTGKLIANLDIPDTGSADPVVSPSVLEVVGEPVVSGRTLVMSGVSLKRFGSSVHPSNITLDAATVDASQVVDGYNLKYVAGVTHPVQSFFSIDIAPWLGYSSVTIASVVRESDMTTLTEGVDYAYSENGKIAGRVNVSDFPVTVTFTGRRERYDAIVYNLTYQTLVVRKGIERPITAHEDLYRGAPQAGDIHLWNVYMVGDTIRDVIPTWNWRGTSNLRVSAPLLDILDKGRRRLARLRAKILRGDGIIISGYGDSTTANGAGAYASAADYLPNRPGVDTSIFQGNYYNVSAEEVDFRADQTAITDSVTVNGQLRYKAGPIWRVIDAIEAVYGYSFAADKLPDASEVVYLNQAIGGSTAANTPGNGANAERLAALIAPSGFRVPDVVIVGFGMNSGMASTFAADMAVIISTIKSAGIDVIVWGPHWVNQNGIAYTRDQWRTIQQKVSEVADYYDAAFVPMELFHADEFKGYLGISDYSLTRANWINHPGPYERRKTGELIAQLFM